LAPTHGGLDLLFRPTSVAIIGASDDATRLSGRPLDYLKRAGYAGAIYPVNPRREQVQGLRAYAAIGQLPAVPDVAIVGVGPELALDALRSCADAGVRAAMVFSAGFAEVGAEGARRQAECVALCRESGLRLLGPNCVGSFHAGARFFGTFASMFERGFPLGGNVAMVAQSGAYAQHACHMAQERGLGLHSMISTGNEADVGLGESLAWLVEQPEVRVIMAYAEGVNDPEALIAAFERARTLDKRIVFLKVGSSAAGARAAAAHTAALAGDARVYQGVFRQYGVLRAGSVESQIDMAYACAMGRRPANRSLGVITMSGGFGIHACDVAEKHGLPMPAMPAAAQSRLRGLVPFGAVENPVDTTGQVLNELDRFSQALRVVLDEGGYGAVLVYLGGVPLARSRMETLPAALVEGMKGFEDRLIVVCMLGDADVVARYEQAGLLVFADPARAIAAIDALAGDPGPAAGTPEMSPGLALDAADLPALAAPLSEHAAKAVLARAGVPVLPERLVADADAAVAAADGMGYPVVLKVVSADIPHKTEVGGVATGIAGGAQLRQAHAAMRERVARASPRAHLEGWLVAPMARPGLEMIVGTFRDPVFGPVVMAGLGGVLVEVLGDVSFRRAPVDTPEALRMLAELKAAAVFAGVRGAPPADTEALAQVVAAVSRLACSQARIESIEINPLVVWERGQGAAALDALIVPVPFSTQPS